ncbi:MAG: GNAT family N-acetyltransferase [Hyphomicrobiales bacterium]|nr:GNAT family N-acetyltransferase [Hyphomicrobiales bacterium]MCP4999648.1 GNAT family N-acetyltransferase [Hyphomicrobiales bacterium]
MIKSVDIPEIDTGRMRLTAFTELDVADLANILSEPEVTKNITANGSTPALCRKSAEHRIGWHNMLWAEKGYGVWAVRSKSTTGGTPAKSLLGWCGFAKPDIGEDPEILYGLAPAAWGIGLATEAAGAAIEWLFGKTGQSGVSAVIFHRLNAKSITIVKTFGPDPARDYARHGILLERRPRQGRSRLRTVATGRGTMS